MLKVHNPLFTRYRFVSVIVIWFMSIPILICGGFQPAFLPKWEFPISAVIFFLIITGLEALWLYWEFSLPRTWYKTLAKGLFIVWWLGWLTIGLAATDVGGLPMAHGLWLVLAFTVAGVASKIVEERA